MPKFLNRNILNYVTKYLKQKCEDNEEEIAWPSISNFDKIIFIHKYIHILFEYISVHKRFALK